ncbi:MAG: PAS domain S-box protein, partial [Alphaproteobacteria bacterium]|nr:PAS domain S-box protein [Alphaproteobacteria bacterium]
MQDVALESQSVEWQAAVDSAETAILIIDPFENRIRQFNDAALAMTGYSGYQLKGRTADTLFPGQLSRLSGLTLECLATGKAWSLDLAIVHGDTQTRPVELYASAFAVEGRKYVMLMCADLRTTRRRRAKAEVDIFYQSGGKVANRIDEVFRQLERGNQLILNAAGEGIYGVDADGRTTFLNPAAERMLGWRAIELIGRSAHSSIHHSHEDGSGYPIKACPIYAAFRDGKVHRVDDEVFWRKDGTCFPVEYTSTPIEEKGRLLGAVVVFRDVSAQRHAQAELVKALDEVGALKRRLQLENAYLQDELRGVSNHKEIVGNSVAVRNIVRQIELVAPTEASVLITGESGTGKELIARAIH